MTCATPHPSGATCDMPEGPHEWHTGVVPGSMPPEGVDWPNEDFVAPIKHRSKPQREEHKATLREGLRGGANLAEMEAGWAERKEAWLTEAKSTLHRFCQQHEADFTTPEDVWPLLDSPGEMRAFVVPVRHAIKRRWMKEVGAKRLGSTYTTRDGKTFAMNKIVPVYRSLIVIRE